MTDPTLTPRRLIEANVPVVHLKIGECIITSDPVLISTVLGSCVSVTFHHPATGMAAMFHAMLPDLERATREPRNACNFVDAAIERILRAYERKPVPMSEVTVKLLGGACTMRPQGEDFIASSLDVGRKNVEQAKAKLAEWGLKIASEHILGAEGRKVLFYTLTGDVWVRSVRAFMPHLERRTRRPD